MALRSEAVVVTDMMWAIAAVLDEYFSETTSGTRIAALADIMSVIEDD